MGLLGYFLSFLAIVFFSLYLSTNVSKSMVIRPMSYATRNQRYRSPIYIHLFLISDIRDHLTEQSHRGKSLVAIIVVLSERGITGEKSTGEWDKEIKRHELEKRRYMCLHRMVSVSQSMLVVQQATIALNALEGIV